MIKKCILEPNENLESKSLNDCTFYKNVYIYAYYNVHWMERCHTLQWCTLQYFR